MFHSNAKNYGELIEEFNIHYKIDIDVQFELAKQRYFELTSKTANIILPSNNFVIYELKFSKAANTWTLYKLFNYIILTDAISQSNEKLIDISNPPSNLIENAKHFLRKEFATN